MGSSADWQYVTLTNNLAVAQDPAYFFNIFKQPIVFDTDRVQLAVLTVSYQCPVDPDEYQAFVNLDCVISEQVVGESTTTSAARIDLVNTTASLKVGNTWSPSELQWVDISVQSRQLSAVYCSITYPTTGDRVVELDGNTYITVALRAIEGGRR